MNIYIASDHAGYHYKTQIYNYLVKTRKHNNILDIGCYKQDTCDYPEFAHQIAKNITLTEGFGILVCGSGQGMSMAANKHQGIRAAVVWNEEVAKTTRKHNNVNVICLGSRFMELNTALRCVDVFLDTLSSNEQRHKMRIQKINIPF